MANIMLWPYRVTGKYVIKYKQSFQEKLAFPVSSLYVKRHVPKQWYENVSNV